MIFSLTGAFGVLLRPLLFVVYFLSAFTCRNPHRWVFGSWSGRRFADNSAALFEYTVEQNEGVEPIWISGNLSVVSMLQGRGCTVYRPWSLKGIASCLTAGVYVYDGLTKDVNHWLSRGARKVLLRHGVGIKKVERAIEHPAHRLYKLFHGSPGQRLVWSYLLPWHLIRPDLMIATSPEHLRQGQAYYDIGPEKIVVTGFPRNDRLLCGTDGELAGADELVATALARRDRPVFLYLPTFRDVEAGFSFPFVELERMAVRLGIVLLVKLHPVDGMRYRSFVPADGDHLVIVDAAVDANSLFGAVRGLISDYSSVIFDFLLVDKPIVFFVPDRLNYLQSSRSFYFDFDEITPGPKVENVNELEAVLGSILDNGLVEWQSKYQEVLDRFHTYRDARSCTRVYREIVARFL